MVSCTLDEQYSEQKCRSYFHYLKVYNLFYVVVLLTINFIPLISKVKNLINICWIYKLKLYL